MGPDAVRRADSNGSPGIGLSVKERYAQRPVYAKLRHLPPLRSLLHFRPTEGDGARVMATANRLSQSPEVQGTLAKLEELEDRMAELGWTPEQLLLLNEWFEFQLQLRRLTQKWDQQ